MSELPHWTVLITAAKNRMPVMVVSDGVHPAYAGILTFFPIPKTAERKSIQRNGRGGFSSARVQIADGRVVPVKPSLIRLIEGAK